jgi:HEPN domain-containing protein
MSDGQPSAAFEELTRFFHEHSRATLLLRVAAHDYAAARCLLFNGMFEGLILGAQAVEKCLKAYLIFNDPQRPVKALNHSLPKLLAETSALFPKLPLQGFLPLVETFRRHYQARYPDNADASTSKTTAEIRELDDFVIFLNENLPCPRVVKYRTGIYALITFSLGYSGIVTTWESWIKNDNHALLPLIPRINAEYAAVMEALYPTRLTAPPSEAQTS